MGLANRYVPHAIKLATTAGVNAWINQLENYSLEAGISLFEESNGSATDREFVAAKEISPTLVISTSDLTILSTIGFAGIPIAGTAGCTVFLRELPNESVPTPIATANHIKMVCTDGLLVPTGLRAGNNAVARLGMTLHGLIGAGGLNANSGTTVFTYTPSVAITSGAGATTNGFTAGPVKYTISGGSSRLVQGIKDLNVDFGIQVLKEASDGEVYPTHASIISRMARVEFTTSDIELITEIGDGVSISAFAAYFRAVVIDGQRLAPATSGHVSISGTAGMIIPNTLNLRHKQSGDASFVYVPQLNSNLITISTTAAIPTS